MKYQSIPNTRLKPSVICMGAGELGSAFDETESFRLLDLYADKGGTFIDTAKVYADWVPGERSCSEKTIGRWMRSRGNRERMIVATKGAHPELDTMHISRVNEKDIILDIDASLRHLQTDYIDLYWLHRDDPGRPVDEIIEVLNGQIEQGKIRYIGCSNWTAQRIREANRYAQAMNLQGFVGSQMGWSLAIRNEDGHEDKTMTVMTEQDMEYYRQANLAVIPYASQAGGFFSGRYRQDSRPEKASIFKLYYNEPNFRRLDRVEEVAKRLSKSQTEIALSFLISHDFPVFPIIGTRNAQQLEESLLAGDLRLDDHIIRYLSTGER